MSCAAELRRALGWSWMLLSAVALGVLLAPFILPAATVQALAPVCEWKARYGRECALCGMTHAFLAISKGRLRQARQANRASVPLYAALVLNEAAGVWFVSRLWRRRRAGGEMSCWDTRV